ncbi:MAG: NapC/NirT family cytochrome c, partial [Bacteroidales bacterium]|nr:NapC/NirT family cytochrome c [Bacteroidales bacterium]
MKKTSRNILIAALIGLIIGIALMMSFNQVYHYTSENETCTKCHYHPESDASWKQSVHCMNGSGTVTGCAECHLPTDASRYRMKIKMGIKDLWSMLVHDPAEIDYSYRNELDYARKIVYNDACEKCHQDLIPKGISDDGIVAHLYYEENRDKLDLQCISCHMDAGHFDPNYTHKKLTSKPSVTSSVKYEAAAEVKSFENFTETVPGTGAAIRMIAIPGGSFTMGSSDKEPFHQADEAPQKKVTVSPFFMAETEITWDQFWEFFNETMSEGRIAPETIYKNNSREDLDV